MKYFILITYENISTKIIQKIEKKNEIQNRYEKTFQNQNFQKPKFSKSEKTKKFKKTYTYPNKR